MGKSRLLVFTDLDGTLLDHSTYSFAAAGPALLELRERGIPLILCTSKTRAETELHRRALGNTHPFITENGGAVYIPESYFAFATPVGRMRGEYEILEFGTSYERLRRVLGEIRGRFGSSIRGFGDMSPEEVAGLCGFGLPNAVLAKEREYDEPFLVGDEAVLDSVQNIARQEGLHIVTGGRFHHLIGDNDKGRATAELRALYERAWGPCKTVGLGDSLNDLPMLRAVDIPVLVRKPGGGTIPGSRSPASFSPPEPVRRAGPRPFGRFSGGRPFPHDRPQPRKEAVMADFHQTGVVSIFHRLGRPNVEKLERELEEFNKVRPMALVLPTTPQELDSPAQRLIIEELKSIDYLNEIIVTLGRAPEEADFVKAKEMFSVLPQRHRVLWATGPGFQELFDLLERTDLKIGGDGKGRSAWIAYGYILARDESKVIGLHDCDIVNYSRELLGRLFYPIASPHIDYTFCKGYYARVTDRMHGRVTRLFVTPLVRSLIKLFGYLPFLVYLDSFRYPLAGEFSMVSELARINRIPTDWGLEVETLAEIFRNCTLRRVCQVELCETYEHKHQALSPDNPKTGLMKMSIDIAKSIFRNLAIESIILSDSALRTLITNYRRTAVDAIKRYSDDAALNGLIFDFHQETVMVEAFTRAVQIAGEEFMANPLYSPLIPNWNRVTSAIPDFLDRLRDLVEEGNRD